MDRETIQRIVKASGVTAGELILIHFWGEDAERAIANDFAIAVSALGATPVVLQEARSVNRDMFQAATQTSFGERFFSLYAGCDAVLDLRISRWCWAMSWKRSRWNTIAGIWPGFFLRSWGADGSRKSGCRPGPTPGNPDWSRRRSSAE